MINTRVRSYDKPRAARQGRLDSVCVFITGEGESQKKGNQIWSYEERR